MMRVKAVSTSSIDGIRVIAVIKSSVCSGRLTVSSPIWPTATSGIAGSVGVAPASAGSRRSTAAKRIFIGRFMSGVLAHAPGKQSGEVRQLPLAACGLATTGGQGLGQDVQRAHAAGADAHQELFAADLHDRRALA